MAARQPMQTPKSGFGQNGGYVAQHTIVRDFRLNGTSAATAANYGTIFFQPMADGTHRLLGMRVRYATPGNDAGAVTIMLKKVPNLTAAAAGTDMLSAAISLKGAADTVYPAGLSATAANLDLADGDGAAIVLTGTPTALAGLAVETLWAAL